MMVQPKGNHSLEIYLSEYDKLKHEQTQRMGFRDNLIYANLIAITGVVSIVTDDIVRIPVLLVLPMICVALGWTYLVNDEKISAIGRYIRYTLTEKIQEATQSKDQNIFGWEAAHRSDKRRISRKIIQLLVDELVFVVPGLIAIFIFWLNVSVTMLPLKWIAGIEVLFISVLGIQVFSYADLKKGK
jgi:hypothetical protein